MQVVLNKSVVISIDTETFPQLFQQESVDAKQASLVMYLCGLHLSASCDVFTLLWVWLSAS